jgi:hypothetical protein
MHSAISLSLQDFLTKKIILSLSNFSNFSNLMYTFSTKINVHILEKFLSLYFFIIYH